MLHEFLEYFGGKMKPWSAHQVGSLIALCVHPNSFDEKKRHAVFYDLYEVTLRSSGRLIGLYSKNTNVNDAFLTPYAIHHITRLMGGFFIFNN